MNKRIKKKKAKHQYCDVWLSVPKNHTPMWKRNKARRKVSKCKYHIALVGGMTYNDIIHPLSSVSDAIKERMNRRFGCQKNNSIS